MSQNIRKKYEHQQVPVPLKVKQLYQEFKLISESGAERLFEAKLCNSHQKRLIRSMDKTKEIAAEKKDDLSVTSFIQDLLFLQTLYPKSILNNHFEIGENGRQIACVIENQSLLNTTRPRDEEVTSRVASIRPSAESKLVEVQEQCYSLKNWIRVFSRFICKLSEIIK